MPFSDAFWTNTKAWHIGKYTVYIGLKVRGGLFSSSIEWVSAIVLLMANYVAWSRRISILVMRMVWICPSKYWNNSRQKYIMFLNVFAVLVQLSRRLKCTIVIMRCPSSLTFHIFDFSSETVEQNLTKLDRKQDLNALYQVCVFRSDRKNKMAALAPDWLRHFRLLIWNRWTEFNETWQEARSQCPLPSLCFSGRSKKQDGCPCLWLAETFSTSPLKPLNRIQRNLTGSKI